MSIPGLRPGAWVANGRRAYKVVRVPKNQPSVVLRGQWLDFTTSLQSLEAGGYHVVKRRPNYAAPSSPR